VSLTQRRRSLDLQLQSLMILKMTTFMIGACVCRKLRPLDLVRESLNVGYDGRADLPALEPGFFTLQVQEPT
jgi:hypothetical protein